MPGLTRVDSRAPPLWSVILGHSADTITVIALLLLVVSSYTGMPRRVALSTLFATLVLGVLVALVKRIFRRERPPGEWGKIYRRTDPYAFPSGHAARVGMLAVVAWQAGPAVLAVSLSVWSLAVCASRLALGVHRRIDILCGLGLGVAFGLLWTILSITDRLGIGTLGQY